MRALRPGSAPSPRRQCNLTRPVDDRRAIILAHGLLLAHRQLRCPCSRRFLALRVRHQRIELWSLLGAQLTWMGVRCRSARSRMTLSGLRPARGPDRVTFWARSDMHTEYRIPDRACQKTCCWKRIGSGRWNCPMGRRRQLPAVWHERIRQPPSRYRRRGLRVSKSAGP
jgi:hypothetical protein